MMIENMTTREKSIYDRLCDEKSKEIFSARKKFAENGDYSLFIPLLEKPSNYDNLAARLKNNKFILYGAGFACQKIIDVLQYENCLHNCVGIMDRNPKLDGHKIANIPVTSPSLRSTELLADLVVISISKYTIGSFNEIIEFLEKIGFDTKNIFIGYDLYANTTDQYFDDVIIIPRLTNKEVFADMGSCNFETSLRLLELCNGVNKIYAFEPSTILQDICRKAIDESKFDNCVFLDNALWHKNTQLKLGPDMFTNFEVLDVKAITFDSLTDNEVTFIKMDIEGAELNALKGCAQSILKYKPKLAISIYHKAQDYIDIPEYILSLVPEYKLYLRHYTARNAETVLYAVI